MPVIRVSHDKENPYVVMNKTGLDDPALSFKAKGLLAYLLSKPDHWEVYISYLAKQSTDGLTAVRSGIKELQDHGYMIFDRRRESSGKFSEGCYVVYERPRSGFPHVDSPNEDNRTLVSNDFLVSNDNSKGERDFLTDAVQQAKAELETADRPRGWSVATEDEYEVCKRVARHWRSDILPKRAKHIEESLAGATELLSMHEGDRRSTLLTLDQYHVQYEKEDSTLSISGPQSLVNVIPAFLSRQQKTTQAAQHSMDDDPQVQAFRQLREQELNNVRNKGEGTARTVGDTEPQGLGDDTS